MKEHKISFHEKQKLHLSQLRFSSYFSLNVIRNSSISAIQFLAQKWMTVWQNIANQVKLLFQTQWASYYVTGFEMSVCLSGTVEKTWPGHCLRPGGWNGHPGSQSMGCWGGPSRHQTIHCLHHLKLHEFRHLGHVIRPPFTIINYCNSKVTLSSQILHSIHIKLTQITFI